MKAIGVVRRVDKLGRIVVPVEVRREFGIEIQDPVEIFTEDDSIILKKYCKNCTFCGNADDVRQFEGKNICSACMEAIADEINKH
ncbi:AbrB/MazE/SpoVT family DNA-binding domain-containing protein [Lachnospiraceae bacterium MD329]|nr:AbrB/MazE/SpoVT family DNA-binding domain-containing protein [Lachnospiraceae bacterium MD329]